MRTLIATAFVLAGITACATNGSEKVAGAAATPLSDLNLVNAPIPEILMAAQRSPYGLPSPDECKTIADEIQKLDEVLGPDLDTPVTEANRGLIERGGDAAGDAAVSAIQRSAEGVIPLRGWIRKISGAERYSKRVAAAIAAGTVRRAFLKGLRVARSCS
jgi:hypothetical protein